VLQCVAVPCQGDLDEPAVASTLNLSICVAGCCRVLYGVGRMLQGVVGCCRVLYGVGRMLQGVAGCCRVLQGVAVCCRVL